MTKRLDWPTSGGAWGNLPKNKHPTYWATVTRHIDMALTDYVREYFPKDFKKASILWDSLKVGEEKVPVFTLGNEPVDVFRWLPFNPEAPKPPEWMTSKLGLSTPDKEENAIMRIGNDLHVGIKLKNEELRVAVCKPNDYLIQLRGSIVPITTELFQMLSDFKMETRTYLYREIEP